MRDGSQRETVVAVEASPDGQTTDGRGELFGMVLLAGVASVGIDAAGPIQYRVSFPEPQHRWMQVEADVSRRLAAARSSCV